eukprot:TRINITY_DN3040_c0_g1_i1.p1 TRINITY_DN3040_c0_g1~~TRINITY_DN3040_c0_g1_i1.p1  ORF type:complete len:160 (+),score=46.93 TRINITY_DN3040_c0_g1_i1:44-523(+)
MIKTGDFVYSEDLKFHLSPFLGDDDIEQNLLSGKIEYNSGENVFSGIFKVEENDLFVTINKINYEDVEEKEYQATIEENSVVYDSKIFKHQVPEGPTVHVFGYYRHTNPLKCRACKKELDLFEGFDQLELKEKRHPACKTCWLDPKHNKHAEYSACIIS